MGRDAKDCGWYIRMHYGLFWKPDEEYPYDYCVRWNERIGERYRQEMPSYRKARGYQTWRKHLYKTDGICRRCKVGRFMNKLALSRRNEPVEVLRLTPILKTTDRWRPL